MTMTPARAPMPNNDDEVPVLKGVRLEAVVTGLLLEATLHQQFKNERSGPVEAIYTFPLAAGAELTGVDVRIGDTRRTMVVAPASLVETSYEDAIEDGDLAIRVEKNGEGLFTASLGNLGPGESAELIIHFAQLLAWEAGRLRLAFPTTIAPRFGDPNAAGLSAETTPETDLLIEYPFEAEVVFPGAYAQASIFSPSHAIAIDRQAGNTAARLAAVGGLDRDFVLMLEPLAPEDTAAFVDMGDDGVALVAAFAPPPLPYLRGRTLHLMLDCSGSMKGDSIEAAKGALLELGAKLDESCSFTFTAFGSDCRTLIETPILFNAAGRQHLAATLDAIDASMGGTELEPALQNVLASARSHGGDILLITDGLTWHANATVQTLRDSKTRVFAIGVGAAPAQGSLRDLCFATGGAAAFVATHEDVTAAVAAQIGRLRLRAWNMLDLVEPSSCRFIAPLCGPAFAGDGALLVALFAAAPTQPVRARLGSEGESFELTFPPPRTLLRSLAAAKLVAGRWARTLSQPDQETLYLRYGVIGQHTSGFLIEARDVATAERQSLKTIKVRQQLPAGYAGIGSVRSLHTQDRSRRRLNFTPILEDQSSRKSKRRRRKLTDRATRNLLLRERHAYLIAAIKRDYHAFQTSYSPDLWIDLLIRMGLPQPVADSIMEAIREAKLEGDEACELIAAVLKEHLGAILPAHASGAVALSARSDASAQSAIASAWRQTYDP